VPIYKLAPIDIRSDDPKWAASTLKEPVWVEAPDDLAACHLVEGASLQWWISDLVNSFCFRRGWMTL
jgi:hypothetical protein